MKQLSREQVEKRKAQAVRFTRDVVGDPDRADEIDDESLESYAERRKIQLTNPKKRGAVMANTLKEKVRSLQEQLADAEAEIETLEDANEELEEKLDDILDIAAPEEGEEEDPEPGEDG